VTAGKRKDSASSSSSDARNEGLTVLGSGETKYPSSPDDAHLETFTNPHPERDYLIHFDCPEFTCLCPVTAQPDFGHISIEYVPAKHCVESKSLKLYLFSFRNEGAFGEAVVNRILDDFVKACAPRRARIKGSFTPRGGIRLEVTASYPPSASP
jgi:7-cyano-7-deazaguanine reductase